MVLIRNGTKAKNKLFLGAITKFDLSIRAIFRSDELRLVQVPDKSLLGRGIETETPVSAPYNDHQETFKWFTPPTTLYLVERIKPD